MVVDLVSKEGVMPREIIRSVCEPFHVKVGWPHGNSVQVGVEGDANRSLFWLLLGNDEHALLRLGRDLTKWVASEVDQFPGAEDPLVQATFDIRRASEVLNMLDVATEIPAPGYQGVWATLDRQGVNRLIRTLRKARDAAYGVDE